MNNRLETAAPAPPGSRAKRHPNGWTPKRRARQAASIRRWQPWRRSAGPKTEAGKARVAMNALRHGYRSRAWIDKAKRIRRAIRLCAQTVLLVRLYRREEEHRALLERAQRSGARRYAAHLIEQPIDAIWSFGPRPVSATSFIAS